MKSDIFCQEGHSVGEPTVLDSLHPLTLKIFFIQKFINRNLELGAAMTWQCVLLQTNLGDVFLKTNLKFVWFHII